MNIENTDDFMLLYMVTLLHDYDTGINKNINPYKDVITIPSEKEVIVIPKELQEHVVQKWNDHKNKNKNKDNVEIEIEIDRCDCKFGIVDLLFVITMLIIILFLCIYFYSLVKRGEIRL